MMSQNRQAAKDRLAAEIDHQVNTKAELEIGNLILRLDELERTMEESQSELKDLLGDGQAKIKLLPKPQRTQRKTSKKSQ
jgi:uncharacterized membrane protein